MFTWKTIKEDYYNPVFKISYQYIEKEIREILQKEGLTDKNKHDLWKCLLHTAEQNIPYWAFCKIDSHIAYFFTDLYFILFQKSILKRAIKEFRG